MCQHDDNCITVLETCVNQDKISRAEQQYQQGCTDNALSQHCHNILKHKNGWLRLSSKFVGMVFSTLAMVLISYSWVHPEILCDNPIYSFHIFHWLFLAGFLFILLKDKLLLKQLARRVVPYFSKINTIATFENIKADLPTVTTRYELTDDHITYKRNVQKTRRFIWKKPLVDLTYQVHADIVIFYQSTSIYPDFMLFIESDNLPILLQHLKRINVHSYHSPTDMHPHDNIFPQLTHP